MYSYILAPKLNQSLVPKTSSFLSLSYFQNLMYFITAPTDDVSSTAKSQPNIYIETPLCWATQSQSHSIQQLQPNTIPLPAPRNVSKHVVSVLHRFCINLTTMIQKLSKCEVKLHNTRIYLPLDFA